MRFIRFCKHKALCCVGLNRRASSIPVLSKLSIHVNDTNDSASALQLGMDESYTLIVDDGTAVDGVAASLSAATVWGALRGLESFSQLIDWLSLIHI